MKETVTTNVITRILREHQYKLLLLLMALLHIFVKCVLLNGQLDPLLI